MLKIPTTIKSKELVKKRREQIVRSAIKLFARKGYYRTTLQDLAEDLGVSHGNIYKYVGSKEDIHFLIHEYLFEIVWERTERGLKDISDPVEKLRRLIKCRFSAVYDLPEAFLLMYRQSHVLNRELLKTLLKSEREALSRIEEVLDECVKEGLVRDFNTRVVSNLLSLMVDTWALKRWDLRGHTTQLEMENTVLDIFFHGLLPENSSIKNKKYKDRLLQGKSALIINGGSVIGKVVSTMLFSKGVRTAIYAENFDVEDVLTAAYEMPSNLKLYSGKDVGPMTDTLLEKILGEFGPFDYLIDDLGADITGTNEDHIKALGERITANLTTVSSLEQTIKTEMSKRRSGRIVYICPWAWDRFIDPLRYDLVKSGVTALTKRQAKLLAPWRINVNCIIPGFLTGIRPSKTEKEQSTAAIDQIPMGCLGEIGDITEAVMVLIGDASKYITGQILNVAGGLE
jgi:AcrR family transcriptional regulator/NAD(P)-dependent dehydrogenase (short-subunit alcohol dehydrogenase family)